MINNINLSVPVRCLYQLESGISMTRTTGGPAGRPGHFAQWISRGLGSYPHLPPPGELMLLNADWRAAKYKRSGRERLTDVTEYFKSYIIPKKAKMQNNFQTKNICMYFFFESLENINIRTERKITVWFAGRLARPVVFFLWKKVFSGMLNEKIYSTRIFYVYIYLYMYCILFCILFCICIWTFICNERWLVLGRNN